MAITSAAGFAAHAGEASLDVPVTLAFTGAAVVAALVAGRVGARIPTDRLRRWFAWLVLTVAGLIAAQLIIDLLA